MVYLLDAAPKCLTYGEASVLTQSLILFLFTTIINLVRVWQNVPVQCVDTSSVILQVSILNFRLPDTVEPKVPSILHTSLTYGFLL